MRAVVRLVAVVLMLGELQGLPAVQRHAQAQRAPAAHCHEAAPAPAPGGPRMAAAADATHCPLMPCCAAPVTAARLDEAAPLDLPSRFTGIATAGPLAPPSRSTAPTPPPPEA